MKKHIGVIFFFLLTTVAYGQLDQGTKMVGGSIGLSSHVNKTRFDNTTRSNSTETEFSIQPQFGYFVVDRLALGAGLNLSYYGRKSKSSDARYNASTLELTPFMRYYLQNRIFFHGQFGVGTWRENDRNDTDNGSLFSWSMGAGYAAFLNDHVAIEPMIGYGSTIEGNSDNNAKSLRPGLFLRVGFQVYLR